MGQVNKGNVITTNGSPTVYGVNQCGITDVLWDSNITGQVGAPFTPAGEILTFAPSGAVGLLVEDNVSNIVFTITSGIPLDGDVVTGDSSSSTATLSSPARRAFQVGETITFTGGDVGKVLSVDYTTGTLRYQRVSGTPDGADVITGSTSTGTAIAVAPTSTTFWQSGGDGEVILLGAFPSIFNKRGVAVAYDVAAVVSDDELTLSGNYLGTSEDDIRYTISQDFDSETGLALLNHGNVDVPTLWTRNITQLKKMLGSAIGLFQEAPSFAGGSLKTSRINVGETALELFKALDAAGDSATGRINLPGVAGTEARLIKDSAVTSRGGQLLIEADDDTGGNDYYVSIVSGMLKFGVVGGSSFTWDPGTGRLTTTALTVTSGLDVSLNLGDGQTVQLDYDAVFLGKVLTIGTPTGAFTDEEVLDFVPSGAVGRLSSDDGSSMTIHLVSGIPTASDTVYGRSSGESVTVSAVDEFFCKVGTDSDLNPATSPDWIGDAYNGLTVEITGGTGIGQTRSVSDTFAAYITITPTWTTPPDGTSTFRIYDATENRLSAKLPYVSYVPMTSNQVISTAAEVALTELSNLAAPGADGSRYYRLHGVINFGGLLDGETLVRVRVGPLGTISDPLIQEFRHAPESAETLDQGILIPLGGVRIRPDPVDKLTISLVPSSGVARTVYGGNTAGRISWVEMEEVHQR